MTWVIGNICKFGYGILVSDIQITYSCENEIKYLDCLQKVYHVGNHVVAGFAGSVSIGFELIKDLNLFPPKGYENYYVNPYEIAERWPERARKIFNAAPKIEQKSSASILMVAAYPSEKGVFDKICMIKLSSPDFKPEIKDKVNDIISIGCGAGVKEYTEAIKQISFDPIHPFHDPLLMAELRYPGISADSFARYLFNQLEKTPQKGISKNLHIATVNTNGVLITNNDMGICYPGRERIELKMPKVVQSYEDLCNMLKADRVDEATC